MIKVKILLMTLLVVLRCGISLFAQTPSDAIMMKKKQACVLVEYNHGRFDQYWEGSVLRKNRTIATVKRNTVMPMVAIGVFNKLNLYVALPYISTASSENNGGRFAGVSGLQDLSLAVKYQFLNKETTKGSFSALGTIGFSTPASTYLPDYMPYSLGLGAPELSYRAITQYKLKNGLYLRAAAAYLWRGYAKAEREYYYNNGSFYTPWMDVPNALTVDAAVGLWAMSNSLQIELSYFGSKSTSGDDIRIYNAPQPTNKIEIGRLGIFGHYYFSKLQGLGVIAYHNQVVNGRNAPKINTTGAGLTYVFNYLKK
jgi:hypothetical protein